MRIKLNHLKFAFLFFLIAFLVGIQNFFFAKFDVSIFRDGTFWSNTVSTTGTYYLTIVLVVLMYVEFKLNSDTDTLDNKGIIHNFVLKDLKPSFYMFNDEENINAKTEAWKNHIQDKMTTLEEKATMDDRMAWRNKDESNKYVLERMNLLDLMNDDYIKENIHYLKVDYEKIDVSTIISGYTPKKAYRFKRQNNVWKITKDTAPKFILSTIYTIFLTSFALTMKEFNMETLYKTIVTMIGLGLSVVWALNYAPQFFQEQVVIPLTNTVLHIKKYMLWEKKRGGSNENN